MNKRFAIFAAGFLLLGATFAQIRQKNIVDEVIWVVGDNPILLSDVEDYRVNAEAEGQVFKDPYAQIPEQIAIQKLFLHQAELDSVEVSDADVIAYADAMLAENVRKAGSKETLEAIMHKSYAQIRQRYIQQTREQQLMDGVRRKLTANIKVTPAEVRDYFSKVPVDSLPSVPTQVEVQIITQQPKVSREEIERIEEQLNGYAKRVNDGEDFARIARMYSQDGSARNGGELGLSGRNQWVKPFADVAFSLNDPKKVSKIVKTEFGYHIIQLIEKRGDKVNARHILLKPEIKAEEVERCISRLDSIGTDIRNNKFSFEDAARELSDDKDTRNNHGLMVQMSPMQREIQARFEMKDLPQDVAKVVDTLKVGQVSNAFTMIDPKTGQEVCAIVKLRSRIESHPANATEDFQTLRNVYLNRRKQEVIQKWIADKIKSTYTRISPEWRNHQFEYSGWIK